jgi:CRISPR-associated protein Cmr1
MILPPISCKIVSPIFCYGADQKTLEIRAESIRGAMRFWWRALHPDLVERSKNDKGETIYNYKNLYEAEAAIFGSTKTKSSVSIVKIESPQEKTKISYTPHHRSSYCKKTNENCYFKEGSNECSKSYKKNGFSGSFKITFKNNLSEGYLKNLLFIVGVLGGIGRRTRRGFGRFVVDGREVNNESINKAIESINPKWEKNKEDYLGYPFLKSYKFSQRVTYRSAYKPLLIIGEASHKFNSGYENSALGYTKGGRLASTMIAGVIPSKVNCSGFSIKGKEIKLKKEFPDSFQIINVELGHSKKGLETKKVQNFIDAINF